MIVIAYIFSTVLILTIVVLVARHQTSKRIAATINDPEGKLNSIEKSQPKLEVPTFEVVDVDDIRRLVMGKGYTQKMSLNNIQSKWTFVKRLPYRAVVIEVFGNPGPYDVSMVRGTIYDETEQDTSEFAMSELKSITRIPYEGSDPRKAMSWLAKNIDQVSEIKIGEGELMVFHPSQHSVVVVLQPSK